MTLDELLLEWSYKTERGYPSLDNPSDVLVLEKILNELNLPTYDIIQSLKEQEDAVTVKTDDEIEDEEEFDSEEEQIPNEEPPGEKDNDDELSQIQGGSVEYDNLIKKTLGVENIPTSNNLYKFSKNTFIEQVKGEDLKIWKDLWEAKPDKKTEKGKKRRGRKSYYKKKKNNTKK